MSPATRTTTWARRPRRPQQLASEEVLAAGEALVTSDHVLVETWTLLATVSAAMRPSSSGRHFAAASRSSNRSVWSIFKLRGPLARPFRDQDLSIVDRTCFAVMPRLGLQRVVSFDDDFAVFGYGRHRERAFTVAT